MIYKINQYNNFPVYFVNQNTYEKNVDSFKFGKLIVGNYDDALNYLKETQAIVYEQEKNRFSMCTIFTHNGLETWVATKLSDVENGTYQVFNHNSGLYTKFNSKFQAIQFLDELKINFMKQIGLANIEELTELPSIDI